MYSINNITLAKYYKGALCYLHVFYVKTYSNHRSAPFFKLWYKCMCNILICVDTSTSFYGVMAIIFKGRFQKSTKFTFTMKTTKLLLILIFGLVCVSAFGGNDDKFIKKYAMMKIYESCFGPEVVQQIRNEMKAACAKCAALEIPVVSPMPIQEQHTSTAQFNNNEDTDKQEAINNDMQNENENSVNEKPNFDPEKLHQAILAYRPNPFQPTFRPYQQTPGVNPGFYAGFASPGPMFYPASPAGFQGGPTGFQGGPIPYTPAYPQFPPFYQPGYFGGQRMSRDMDMKNQLEALTAKMSGKVRNVTCVMQELGYLDENMEPNYERIQMKIASLPIPQELKQDIQEGVQFCQQFSQCVPEVKKDKSPLSSELIKPMFFFRCYKHKKLEACVMKDVRDRFNGEDETLSESDVEIRRTGKAEKLEEKDMNDLASSVYEFLYGGESMDFDSIL